MRQEFNGDSLSFFRESRGGDAFCPVKRGLEWVWSFWFAHLRNAARFFASNHQQDGPSAGGGQTDQHWLGIMLAQNLVIVSHQNPERDCSVTSDSTLDLPRATDFVDPYFFFSSCGLNEVAYVSPSVQSVLGYDPNWIPGHSYTDFLFEGDPLNDDIAECQRADLSDGSSIHALRSVKNSNGDRRILSIHTVGVSKTPGGPVVRRHNIARDVTESVQAHTRLMSRLQALEQASRQMTRQERDVAERILQGMMNRDIARDLEVSDRTVERRRASIMKRLDAATTPELVSKLVERDMLRTWTCTANDTQWQMARNSHLVNASLST